tara:strand:- start:1674 stop:2345 length:672 start_codon:yes stop_codon:yes gene_type:complete
MTENIDGLKLLREPFAAHHISKLPKPTKHQTEMVKKDFKTGMRCGLCGGWHHKDVIHLDYVGHAALTDRLLDADIAWSWEALSLNEQGLPAMDANRGMWIKLTVCGITRLGYGDAGDKTGGNAIKEVIGDALRNAAMRFGAALDLWHKGDLHDDDVEPVISQQQFEDLCFYCAGANGFWSPTGTAMLAAYNIGTIADLPASKFKEALDRAKQHANNQTKKESK